MSAADFATIREALGFLSAVARSREPWTAQCGEIAEDSRAALARVEADTLTPEEAGIMLRHSHQCISFGAETEAKLGRIAGGGWSKPTDADIERGQELAKEHGW